MAAISPAWLRRRHPAVGALKAIVLVVIVAVIVLPFLYVLEVSLLTEKEVIQTAGIDLLPQQLVATAYQEILSGAVVQRAMVVSIGITVVGTTLSLLTTIALAFGLSRPGVPFRRVMLLLILLTFLFSPGLIPSYLMVKQLGLLNSYGSLILPGLVSTFNFVVLRGFFMNIPQDLLDSAYLDGANSFAVLRLITIPLSKAVIAVIGLFYAVGYWNSFFNALLYLNDAAKWPIQLVLRQYVVLDTFLPSDAAVAAQAGVVAPTQAIQMAIVVVAMVPILIVYPFLQRYFTTGVLTGAIKS
jgi:ABC-type glycerol-3-phosphate transport system permease component